MNLAGKYNFLCKYYIECIALININFNELPSYKSKLHRDTYSHKSLSYIKVLYDMCKFWTMETGEIKNIELAYCK